MKTHCQKLNILIGSIAAFSITAQPAVQAATITWNMGTATPTSINNAEVTGGTISQYNNNGTTALLTTTSPSSGTGTYAGASGTNNAGAATRTGVLNTAPSGSAAFEFTLTPAAGFTLTFNDLLFGSRSTGTGPQAWTLRSSADSFASDIVLGGLSASSAWTLQDASAFSFAVSAATTFRIFGYSGVGSPGANTANWRIDDLQFVYSASGGVTFTWIGDGLGATWQDTANGHFGSAYANSTTTPSTFTGTGEVVTLSGPVQSGGLTINSDTYSFTDSTLELGASGVTVTTAAHTATIQSVISGANGLNKAGAGKLVLSGSNTYTGTNNISAGTLAISNDNQLGATTNAVQLGGGKLLATTSLTLDAARALTGSGSIEVGSGATLRVPGATTASGLTFDGAGTLALSGATAISTLTHAGTGTVALSGTTPTITTLAMSGAGTVSSTNAVLNNGITTTHTTGTATVSAPLDFGAASRNITVADGAANVDLLLSGALAMTGTGRLIKLGDGTMEMTGTNSIVGLQLGTAGSTPVNGGRVIIHDADDVGTLIAASAFRFNAGTLEVQGSPLTLALGASIGAGQIGNGATFTGSPITFQGASSLFRGGVAATSYQHKITANADVTFDGGLNVSSGSGTSTGLTIAGNGTVILNAAANTITENITVDGGNLEVSGSLTGTTIPSITTQNLGILSGNSTGVGIAEVIVGANGLVDPGTIADSTGTLNITNFTVQATGGLNFDIGGIALGDSDQLNATGTVTLSGTLITSLVNGYVPGNTDTITIIANDGGDAVSGTFTGLAEMSAVGATGLFITYAGGDGNDVVLTAVPEPGSAVLLLGGFAILGARRRRRG